MENEVTVEGLKPRESLITEITEALVSLAEDSDKSAKKLAYNLSDWVVGRDDYVEEAYKQLLVHEIVDNVERALELDLSVMDGGEIFIAADKDEARSNVRSDVYAAVKSLQSDSENGGE